MEGRISSRVCLTALVLAVIGQTVVELKWQNGTQLYTIISYGTLVCWVIFIIFLNSWVRSDWFRSHILRLQKDIEKSVEYEDSKKNR